MFHKQCLLVEVNGSYLLFVYNGHLLQIKLHHKISDQDVKNKC